MEKKEVYTMLGIAVAITVALIAYCLLYGNQYVVMFDVNGGSNITTQLVRVGNKIEAPDTPTREGFKFIEWQLDGKKFDFDTPVRKNVTLKARWQKVTTAEEIYYTVMFDTAGGTEIMEQYIAVGAKVEQPTNPVREGYEFKGWYYNNTKYDFDKKVSQDMVLVAKWEED